MESETLVHNGGCHCRRVRWKVLAPSNVMGLECNCSDCSMRGSGSFFVPCERFELLADSKQFLTTYTFGTHAAKHTFCKGSSIYLILPASYSINYYTVECKESMESEMLIHKGGCHCKNVRWQVKAPSSVVAWDCNCSNCNMRGNTGFVVPSESFELLGTSKQFLTTYTFGTHTAKHTFCRVCGITSFFTPRSNPDGIAVMFRCVDPGTLIHVEVKRFDGGNWEDSYAATGIASCSKMVSESQK